MPANLTPDYLEAERRFKSAKTTEEKVAAIEEMMATIPGTRARRRCRRT